MLESASLCVHCTSNLHTKSESQWLTGHHRPSFSLPAVTEPPSHRRSGRHTQTHTYKHLQAQKHLKIKKQHVILISSLHYLYYFTPSLSQHQLCMCNCAYSYLEARMISETMAECKIVWCHMFFPTTKCDSSTWPSLHLYLALFTSDSIPILDQH